MLSELDGCDKVMLRTSMLDVKSSLKLTWLPGAYLAHITDPRVGSARRFFFQVPGGQFLYLRLFVEPSDVAD